MKQLLFAIAVGCATLFTAPALHAQSDFTFDSQPIVVTPEHEAAVKRGLQWLADHQRPDGAWSGKVGYKLNSNYRYDRTLGDGPHVGVTALACMAFLAGGQLPGRGEHSEAIERGLSFVLSCCNPDGYITYAGTRMYSHAFATLFLAEIYGMTHRKDVRERLQRAVDFIVTTQNAQGGWRYVPFQPESDMSIVVCQVLALRAARNIGIRVPKGTIDRAAKYVVDSAITSSRSGRRSHTGLFNYQKTGGGSRQSFPLTAAGVTALHGVGIYSDDAIKRGLDFLRSRQRVFNDDYAKTGHYFFWYGHYYAVQAMYTAGTAAGVDYWKPYFTEARETLLDIQRDDGSWPNQTGPGPAFGTAMAVLILEIPYRYLPIFQR